MISDTASDYANVSAGLLHPHGVQELGTQSRPENQIDAGENLTAGMMNSSSTGGSPTAEKIAPYVLLGMTAVTGLVDAVSFLSLGSVFTANMTGNILILAFATARVLDCPRRARQGRS